MFETKHCFNSSGNPSPDIAGRSGAWRHRSRFAPTLFLVVSALLLPNALAIFASIWIGIPPRPNVIAAYALVALLCIRLPRTAAAPLYLVAVAFDVLTIIAHIFFLDLSLIYQNIPAFTHVRTLASPLYTGMLVALSLFLAANIAFLMRYRALMARGNKAVLALAVVACLAADLTINGSANLDLGPAAGIGQPFRSGVQMSGFDEVVGPSRPKRHVLLVLVESLGQLRDLHHRKVLFSAFDDEALKERFSITTGTTSFFGSTAYGEMRELCQLRSSYGAILDEEGLTCLPALFATRGYRTVSVHGFTRAFYDRLSWYPRIGFVRTVFQETANATFKRQCGGPFVGPCDVEIADVISERLSTTSQPMFVYWLTLNSHVPVRAGEATPRHDCATGGPFGDPEVCVMAEIWEDLFAAISRLAIRHPETEILLVGDHAPPLWRKAARGLFEPDRVPWIRLAPRDPTDGPKREATAAP
ncbi:sulfatase-like hydrolase/transferase [uncultured Methylobacterium sp.]|uniref:sulfatase-like hydrolase/transferase n=1 Tax=uncultured Methylobacterium sp. TaxID=157278 RepID=UPI002595587B|nr:sulfatase-like hydrolase/transferase [uncultured Methylobacterium sp.]